MLFEKDAGGFTRTAYTRGLGFPGGIGGLISLKRFEQDDDGLEEKTSYYHYDALGSVRGLSNEQGKLNAEFDYDAFGNGKNNKKWNTYRFSSKEFEDHAGLYFFGARYYDPEIGRWLTPDPLGFIDGLNKYLYVGNNPLNFIDLYGFLGERSLPWWEKLSEGYYYGTGFGTEAVEYWANRYIETGNRIYLIPGAFSSLWTPETYQETGWVLIQGLGTGQYLGRPFYQYYPKNNPGYSSQYLTRGLGQGAPYKPGAEAYKALNLAEAKNVNPGDAVRSVDVKPWEPVLGPRSIEGGTGWEYYRGWTWPKR